MSFSNTAFSNSFGEGFDLIDPPAVEASPLGGGGYMRTGWHEKVKRDDEEILAIISKFLDAYE